MIHLEQILPESSGRLEVMDDATCIGHISRVGGCYTAYAVVPTTVAASGKVCVATEPVDRVDKMPQVNVSQRTIEHQDDAVDLVVMMHRFHTLAAWEPDMSPEEAADERDTQDRD